MSDIQDNPELNNKQITSQDIENIKQLPLQDQFPKFHEILSDYSNKNVIGEVIQTIRKYVSKEHNPPIQEIQDSSLLPLLLKINKEIDDLSPETIIDILWIFTNHASGSSNQVWYLINNGGIQLFLQYLDNANQSFVEQAAWGIGNILGEDGDIKDIILTQHNCIPKLFEAVDKWNDETLLKTKEIFAWILGNVVRGKNKPSVEYQLSLAQYFISFLNLGEQSQNQAILVDTLWGFSYLSDTSSQTLQYLHSQDLIGKLKKYLEPEVQLKLKIPALRTIGNFTCSEDIYVDKIIEIDIVANLIEIIQNQEKNTVKKEGFWILSNIAAGLQSQAQYLANKQQFYDLVSNNINSIQDQTVLIECTYVLANILESTIDINLKFKQVQNKFLNSLIQLYKDLNFNQKMESLFFLYAKQYIQMYIEYLQMNNQYELPNDLKDIYKEFMKIYEENEDKYENQNDLHEILEIIEQNDNLSQHSKDSDYEYEVDHELAAAAAGCLNIVSSDEDQENQCEQAAPQ